MKNLFKKMAVVVSLVATGAASAAAPTTIGELASSVSVADVSLAILAIAGIMIALDVTWKGAKFVLRAIKSA